jgi:two-component sensor histidine kinase
MVKILIAEDALMAADMVGQCLSARGYEVRGTVRGGGGEVEAGWGWSTAVVGQAIPLADGETPECRAFATADASVCNNLHLQSHFTLPAFYAEHGIVATIQVAIKGGVRGNTLPYGVLTVDNRTAQNYDQHDVEFVKAFSNVLAEAVSTSQRSLVLHAAISEMAALFAEKDRLIDQNKLIVEELHHRVRNNLEIVYGMLVKQLEETTHAGNRRGLKAIARRVATLAAVYDHLIGQELTRATDLDGYMRSICLNVQFSQPKPAAAVTLTLDCAELFLDLDLVTALGIITAELVSNCFEHAFPGGSGNVFVSIGPGAAGAGTAAILVRDDGIGFEAERQDNFHGLSLVRRLLDQIGATAALRTGRGTEWQIVFPFEMAPADV